VNYRRRALLLALLLSAATFAINSYGAGTEETPSELRAQAIRFYQEGHLNEALPLYQRLAQLQPNNVYILKNLMWILWKTGDASGTAEAASRAAALLPDDLETLNLLGQACEAARRPQDAIRAYRKLLSLEPKRDDVRLALARLFLGIKDYDAAVAMLEQVLMRKPNSVEAFAALGQLFFDKGSYDASLVNWRKALAAEPGNVHYQFEEAKTLYYAGMPDTAIAQMKKIWAAQPDAQDVSNFLTDDALANGDLSFARELLTSRLTEFREQDEMRILQLTDVLQSRGEWNQSIAVLKRYLNVNSNNGQPLLRMGDVLNHVRRSTEAVTYYERVIEKNPSSIRALVGLADTYINLSRPKEALDVFRQARQLDPTNPTLLLRMAQTLYDAQDYEASRQMLTNWVKQQSEPVLPVLLYHGLTPFPRDPLLAYNVHMTTAAFEDQMKAIHDAGYAPVTVPEVYDWYYHQTPLPKQPILIAFDDARVDAFRYADPILNKYGLRATMFTPTREVDENLPGYASWDELKRYAQTPRWEIQSHGDRAHDHILVDAEGRHGIFLANKIWLPKENRLETLEEWRTRIDADHERSTRKIKENIGTAPVALAWPEGDFGQDSVPNSPDAVAVNLEMARRHFSLAFQEDEFGLNLRSHNPMLLFRLQPKHMSGKALVRYLQDNNPIARAHRLLLQHAVWENRIAEAEQWLGALKRDGVDDSVLLIEEARLQKAGGEDEKAVILAQQAVTVEDSADNRRFLEDLLSQKNHGWTAGTLYQTDNQNRENFFFEQSLDVVRTGPLVWDLTQHYGHYREEGAMSVNDVGGGASMLWTLRRHHQLQLRSDWHSYSDPVKDQISVQGLWNAKWPMGWSSQLEGSRMPYDTARAIDAGVVDRFMRATVQWKDPSSWRVGFSGTGHDLSDGNARETGWAEIGRRIGWEPLQGIVHSSFDRMNTLSPNYYSPRNLQTHQIGFEIDQPWSQSGHVRLRYLPGIGKEDGTSWDFIQAASVSVSIPLGRLSMEPSYAYYMTPTYRAHSYFLSLGLPF